MLPHYQKTDWIKRSNAFDHIIFPAALLRISLYVRYGNPSEARQELIRVLKIYRTYEEKVVEAEHLKAWFVLNSAASKFVKILRIHYQNNKDPNHEITKKFLR